MFLPRCNRLRRFPLPSLALILIRPNPKQTHRLNCPSSSSSVPSGNGAAGSPENPIPPSAGGGLPSGNDLKELDGVFYISGSTKKNITRVECNPGMANVQELKICDIRQGKSACETCGPFNSPNGDCNFSQDYYTVPDGKDGNYCFNNDCELKIKVEFILKDTAGGYPSGCIIKG